MPGLRGSTTFAALSAGAMVAGCQSAPAQYAGTGLHVTYAAASTGAGAVRATGMDLYHGAGAALRAPLHDLNMMQDQIPPVLLRAENKPYDLVGVNSCGDVLNRVSELDLALGPDVDTPKQRKRTRSARGADFAASAALDAAGSAAEHFIPMRGTIKQISGAARYERHAQHAVLAGETRRSFLKAVGMAHGCSWPAAPLDFHPTEIADVAAPWAAPASPAVGVPSARGVVVLAAAAPLPGAVVAPTSLRSASLVAPAAAPSTPRMVLVSSMPMRRPALQVAVAERLSIPPVATGAADPAQAWRPATSRRAEMVEVSAPMTPRAVVGPMASNASLTTNGGAPAVTPWGSTFASPGVMSSARP